MEYRDYLRIISKMEGKEQAQKECDEIKTLLEKTTAKDIPGFVHDVLGKAYEHLTFVCGIFKEAAQVKKIREILEKENKE